MSAEIAFLLQTLTYQRFITGTVGGADRGEILLVGDCEDDPAILALQDIPVIMIIELSADDMPAPYQPDTL
ncbi:MAG: hypothetical protein ACOH2H_23090 [Cypionkella sp.]